MNTFELYWKQQRVTGEDSMDLTISRFGVWGVWEHFNGLFLLPCIAFCDRE